MVSKRDMFYKTLKLIIGVHQTILTSSVTVIYVEAQWRLSLFKGRKKKEIIL